MRGKAGERDNVAPSTSSIDAEIEAAAGAEVEADASPYFLHVGYEAPHVPLFTSPAFQGVSRRGGVLMLVLYWLLLPVSLPLPLPFTHLHLFPLPFTHLHLFHPSCLPFPSAVHSYLFSTPSRSFVYP